MPRMARQKTYDAIFHVMSRSISEVDLFKDEADKLKYLFLIKKYKKLYQFKVYCYCLMDNHVHLLIDANGSDISKVMHGINFSYALYFNGRHDRHGHLFQDRFKSRMIKSDGYLYAASAYIHNNATAIPAFKTCPEKYDFSSLSVYVGLKADPYKIVDEDFIMGLFGKQPRNARENYLKFVFKCKDKKFNEEIEFVDEKTEYRSERKILVRDMKAHEIVEFISERLNIPKIKLHMKNCRDIIEAKALLVVLMRSLCNLRCSDICKILGNITHARVSTLSSIGVELITNDESYRNIVDEFLCFNAA